MNARPVVAAVLTALVAGLGLTGRELGAKGPLALVDPAILVIAGKAGPAHPAWQVQWDLFAAHKQARGLPVEVVMLSDILAGGPYGAPERDNAEKVKNYLRMRKLAHWDTLHDVLIAENYDDGVPNTLQNQYPPAVGEVFPVRYSAIPAPTGDGTNPVSELYYGDLFKPTGAACTWDDDGDGVFGEPGVDDFEYIMNPDEGDLFVGYWPLMSWKTDGEKVLEALVKKVRGYEDPAYANGGFPRRAYPELVPGNWFLNFPLWGADIFYNEDLELSSARHDCERIRDRILLVANQRLPEGIAIQPHDYFPGWLLPNPVPNPTFTIPIFCDRVSQGAGFILTEGHGGNVTIDGTNDRPLLPMYFTMISANWRDYTDFTNLNGPYPIQMVIGCDTLWKDRYGNPDDGWWRWGGQCLGEELATATQGANYTPYGHIACIGFYRGELEDPSFANALLTGYTRGRASRLGEVYNEAQRIWLHRQDLWPDWRNDDPPNMGNTGGYNHINQSQATYVGDPTLQWPAFPPIATRIYQDRAGPASLAGILGNVSCAAAADFDGDGIDDLVLGAASSAAGPDWRVQVMKGNADGTYAAMAQLGQAPDRVRKIAAGDVDGDGDTDLFVANEGPDRLFLKQGAGWTFSEAPGAWGAAGTDPTSEAILTDLDVDGLLDLAVLEAGSLKVWRNAGGSFADATAAWQMSGSANVTALAVADVNSDGLPDLLAGADPASASRFYVGVDEGAWMEAFQRLTGQVYLGGRVEGADFADLDGDADLDLHLQLADAAESTTGLLICDRVFEQLADGTFSDHYGTQRTGGISHRGISTEMLLADLNLDSKDDAFSMHWHGCRFAENRWNWEFAVPVLEDGLPDTDRMRSGCILDAGSGYPQVLSIRYAGHEGTHPRPPLALWSRLAGIGCDEEGGGILPPNHWVRVRLTGRGATDAIGARVTIRSTGDGMLFRTQAKSVSGQGRSTGLCFGLFQDAQVTDFTVDWPSGRRQSVEFAPIDGTVALTEDSGLPLVRAGPVSGVTAAAARPAWDRIDVSWQAASGADAYEIWRSVNGAPLASLTVVPASQTSLPDPHGPSDYGNAYQYRVRAVNGWGMGPWAAPSAAVRFEPRPDRPAEFGAVRIAADCHLNWENPAGGEPVSFYRVWRTEENREEMLIADNIVPSADGHRLVDRDAPSGSIQYRVEAVNGYGPQPTPETNPLATINAVKLEPAGGDLTVAGPGARYQLRAYASSGITGEDEPPSGGTGMPVTYLVDWQSSNPQLPIDPAGTGRLLCNVAGETDVTVSIATKTDQKHYRVLFQEGAAPTGSKRKGR